MAHAADTEVLRLRGGDTIEVAHTRSSPIDWKRVVWDNCPYERGSCLKFEGSDTLVSVHYAKWGRNTTTHIPI